jgi:activating signal cointegrator complex subunit 1
MPRTKKAQGGYNDFLDGEKLHDNADVRTSLQGATSNRRDVSPPATRQEKKGRGKKGKRDLKPQLTHFLCLPLVTEKTRPRLQAGLERLKEELEQSDLVPLKAVRPVGTLHLTLGVMSLDATGLEKATQYLQELDLQSLVRDLSARIVAKHAAENGAVAENLNAAGLPDMQALTIELKGLQPMQKRGDTSNTSILYAEPKDTEGRLYAFGSELRKRFTKGGFLVEDHRALLLHATIINTVYAKPKGRGGKQKALSGRDKGLGQKGDADGVPDFGEQDDDGGASTDESTQDGAPIDRSDGHGPNAKGWRTFDARKLMEQYKEFLWAEDVKIDRVQICKMGAKKILGDDGEVVGAEYEVVAEKGV